MDKVGIIAAMEEEIKVLQELIVDIQKTEIAGMVFIEGILVGKPVVLVKSGIGKVNASIATVCLIQQFGCEAIINTGSGGGLAEGLHVGDVVLSTKMSYFDVDVRVFGYEIGQVPGMPVTYSSSDFLRKETKMAAESVGL